MRPTETHPTAPFGSRSGPFATVRGFRLRVLEGPDRDVSFVASGERTCIGTHRSCNFVLTDRTVSRFHCDIVVSADRAVVRDLDSRNGTRINGLLVREACLEGPATLRLGSTTLEFQLATTPLEIPLAERERFENLVGRSDAMRKVFAELERAAQTDSTVLLQGETGTGKELAAEAIHRASARSGGPLVVVDCGSIPPGLVETELFGCERGAFTDAIDGRAGAFEQADGGTLFFDEVGELEPELQPKLLRSIETRRFRRVGGTATTTVDVRIIGATNRDLARDVNRGRFRADLYYRLAVIEIRLPPLRERAHDIPLLVDEILARAGASDHPGAAIVRSEQVLEQLGKHPWPGNVRELRNYVERCVALRADVPIAPSRNDAMPSIDPDVPLSVARERFLQWFEQRYLAELLSHHRGNVSAAARATGVDRVHLHRLLARSGVKRPAGPKQR